ncbi:MAG: V-type ATPase subunit [Elusimicrobiota bacterium]|jgi:vacuolar-type H+-ATPase subunit C/Vma6|nr:V-type ATPase subunit [Elusimicrobiota bacterium]
MYSYKLGIIYAKESNLLKKTDYDRILSLISVRDVWTELVRLNLGYKEVSSFEVIENISQIFSQNIKNLYLEIVEYFKDEDAKLKKSFLYEFDFYNLKLFYKQKIFKNFENNDKKISFEKNFIDLGYIGLSKLSDYEKNGTLIFEIFDEKDIDFFQIFDILKDEKNNISPLKFDIMLDKILFDYRIKVAKNIKNEFLENFWKKQIDFYNIKIFFSDYKDENKETLFIDNGFISIENFKNVISSNFSDEDLSVFFEKYDYKDICREALKNKNDNGNNYNFEILEEDLLLNFCKESSWNNIALEPIISYFYKKYCEIKNLNRILFNRAFKRGLEADFKISKSYSI